jgi:hypothetical protein
MRTICTGFPRITLLYLFLKKCLNGFDTQIHKYTIIVLFCEGNCWFKITDRTIVTSLVLFKG